MNDTGVISDNTARLIASRWHGGEDSPMLAFAESGAINSARMFTEIRECFLLAQKDDLPELVELRKYIKHHGDRSPMPVEEWVQEEPMKPKVERGFRIFQVSDGLLKVPSDCYGARLDQLYPSESAAVADLERYELPTLDLVILPALRRHGTWDTEEG